MSFDLGRTQALDLHAAIGDLITAIGADGVPGADQAITYLQDIRQTLSIYAGDPRNPRKRAAAIVAVTKFKVMADLAVAEAGH